MSTKKNDVALWVDVTMLVNWSGRMTGIQRVEYNLAKRFAATRQDVQFCVFDKKNGGFIEFDFKHIEFKINTQQETIQNAPLVSQNDSTVVSVSAFKQYTKNGLKRVLPRSVKRVAKRSYGALSGSKVANDAIVRALIKPGDTVLVLSGDWSDHTFADYIGELKKQHNLKVIQIVYDMLPALFPSYFVVGMPKQFTDYMEKMLGLSDAVLAISESTKKDVASFMKDRAMKMVPIDVFRLGDDFVKTDPKQPGHSGLKKNDYILTVCTVEARKNHALLYYAVREAVVRGVEIPTIVFAGKKGWLVDDLYYLIENDPIISKKILFVEQPSDSELAWLYKNALFTVFPSFYEGWGLPVAESLFYGKFCLSSNASSMPEIAGELIDYFSPNDPIGLLEKIELYSKNRSSLTAKEKKIAKEYKMASWDGAFEQVEKAIHKTLSA